MISINLLILSLLLSSAATAPSSADSLEWNDVTRDVFIDGEIDRQAQVMTTRSPRRTAVISKKFKRVVILDSADHKVKTLPISAFNFTDSRDSATTETETTAETVGRYVDLDDNTHLLAVEGKPVLVRPHQGLSGVITEQQIFDTVPLWRSLMEHYTPDAESVEDLKACGVDTKLVVVLGTWCPDSRNYVPKILKAIHQADSPHLNVSFVGISRDFLEPMQTIQQLGITNVPTVIVQRNGREIGRLIETPGGGSMEYDLAALISGRAVEHRGRWERANEIASGVYEIRDRSGKNVGSERWQLFNTAEGGYLLHGEISKGDSSVDVWQRLDAERRPTFAEVTRRKGDRLLRTRFTIGAERMTARFRGSDGVLTQTVSLPDLFVFSSPSAAAEGLAWSRLENVAMPADAVTYVAPSDHQTTVGALSKVRYEEKGGEAATVPAGRFQAKRVIRSANGVTSELWMHPDLPIPVKRRTDDGDVVLVSIKTARQ